MLEYAILGIVQGIFEWLPISSEGVVAVISQFLIKNFQPLEMALFAHLGTFFAVLIYFRKEWFNVLTLKNKILFRFLAIAVIISGIVGFLLYDAIKDMAIGNGLLLVTGLGLLFTAYCHKARKMSEIGLNKLAIVSGILQGLAVIPGLSRSGATIFALSLGKFNPGEILKISYMMSAPAVLAMVVFLSFQNSVLISEGWPVLLFSFLVGFLTLSFLLKIATKINFFKFALIFAIICFLGAGLSFFIQL